MHPQWRLAEADINKLKLIHLLFILSRSGQELENKLHPTHDDSWMSWTTSTVRLSVLNRHRLNQWRLDLYQRRLFLTDTIIYKLPCRFLSHLYSKCQMHVCCIDRSILTFLQMQFTNLLIVKKSESSSSVIKHILLLSLWPLLTPWCPSAVY